ncbi:MAG: Holliday junction resolvase RuvX [Anaerolineales bacterium]
MKILAIDPGQRRIGVAISDPSGKVAFPLTEFSHRSKEEDAKRIIALAEQNQAELILIGQALGIDQQPTLQSRRSFNLAQSIRAQTKIPVVLWDEFETTQIALKARREMGVNPQKRSYRLDALSAAVLLQSYIEHSTSLDHE